MIRKLYKLRRYLCIYFIAVSLLLLVNRDDSNIRHPNVDIDNGLNLLFKKYISKENSSNPATRKKEIITIDTYVSPQPCINCPGENGSAVTILVSIHI